ncbi:MAG: Tim44 domain-containing protein [Hyphomonas sp.]|uniref:Tim44/TimA family putative adaptor protein n=1 Tax=Hyphomonas sp. TaxID=87 RepID=UPI001790F010|nr:Tim44/TimA family putative adaptor protein [Hyphomonas sp.]MBU3921098.1 Tim44/TimA family putative adaptor protein [Alphaproteobacteria bacterium]MBA3070474.1 Tim44 domain-containing protein [Hyphomonas sp.]MBU4062004.1 Tim44/TimA family putative adaptor protein [Alphaproteobacteria bacterium]MBU4164940.1 Tim44/TimA family putative adaptor protein [Alphaproteobacteria bacterium]MBU4567855.1 Tim44/TimA family putative adaptor protein [Alphaproteobacteria bacterium]
MSNPVIEVLILAAVALFVLWRLYVALGRGGDERPMQRPAPAPEQRGGSQDVPAPAPRRSEADRPVFTGPAAAGLEDIYEADRTFTAESFLRGAKAAYQMIVGAYARGDREALRPLLDDDVFAAWDAAITAREGSGERAFELLRIKRAEIDRAELESGTARVSVRYEADLGDGETTRTAKEIWTFKRNVASSDPNWLLDDVDVAG